MWKHRPMSLLIPIHEALKATGRRFASQPEDFLTGLVGVKSFIVVRHEPLDKSRLIWPEWTRISTDCLIPTSPFSSPSVSPPMHLSVPASVPVQHHLALSCPPHHHHHHLLWTMILLFIPDLFLTDTCLSTLFSLLHMSPAILVMCTWENVGDNLILPTFIRWGRLRLVSSEAKPPTIGLRW